MNDLTRQKRRDALVEHVLDVLDSDEIASAAGQPTIDEIAAAGRAIAARLTAGWTDAAQPAIVEDDATDIIDLAARRERRAMRIPGRHIDNWAAGTSGPVDRFADDEFGIVLTRKTVGDDTLLSITFTGHVARDGDVVRVRRAASDRHTQLLVLLYVDDQGMLTGQILTAALAATSDDLDITVSAAGELTADDCDAVTAAVRASHKQARNAWRRLAKAQSADSPIRTAVIEGFR
ncbi:hypothetical protein ACFVMC_26565 [Nocardia sp. NPDC127579]|uniref:hypothetical protein n=1 Tax=Nocardia sp. NPDC127579 TaxID=3345402 RepID=UPI003625C048